MKYLAIDVETTGQYLTKNALIAFGCTIMNDNYEELDSFIGFLSIPSNKTYEERCVKEFWSKNEETLKYILENSKDPKKVMNEFALWLNNNDLKYGDDMIVLSDTSSYDFAWINVYLSEYTDRPSIYYKCVNSIDKNEYAYRRIFDTNSAYHGALVIKKQKYIEWNLEKELDCQNNKWTNDHNPLNDARNIAYNYILFLNSNIKKFKNKL